MMRHFSASRNNNNNNNCFILKITESWKDNRNNVNYKIQYDDN